MLLDITQKGEAYAHQICNHFQMPLELFHRASLLIAVFILRFANSIMAEAQRLTLNANAVLELSFEHASYPAKWFYVLAAVLLAIMFWAAYRIRLGILTNRARNLLAERLSERERLARELYDTLLQGMQGLILLFQSIAVQIPSDTPLAFKLETAISRAERLMVDGRDSVRDLRAPNFDLADALRSLNAEQRLSETEYSVRVNGRERELQLLVSDEIFKIAREAIVNACQHAFADHVRVTLTYRLASLELTVDDDGRDVRSDISEDGMTGRWGLSGMKGRARKLESRLLISNRSPTGTEVHLSVPASVAYRSHMFFVVEWIQRVSDLLRRWGSRL